MKNIEGKPQAYSEINRDLKKGDIGGALGDLNKREKQTEAKAEEFVEGGVKIAQCVIRNPLAFEMFCKKSIDRKQVSLPQKDA